MTLFIEKISSILAIKPYQVENTMKLLDEGATIPFISRYRKEMTGSLDEVQIGDIKKEYERLQELEKRREFILESIDNQEKLTDELRVKIEAAETLTELEDLYLPYKPKKVTRAKIARDKGLEPLAKILMTQKEIDVMAKAQEFLTEEVEDPESALQGARDIIAEWINENAVAREKIRKLFTREATICSKVVKTKKAEPEAQKYTDYFDFTEPLKRCPSHRLLAIFRGEKEGYLRVDITPPEEMALENLAWIFVKDKSLLQNVGAQNFEPLQGNNIIHQIILAIKDSYKRLLGPSIQTEFQNLAKTRADQEAISVFAKNLRQLLLASPLGQKRVLAIDPGYRTGCKVVCLDPQGYLLTNDTIYPHPPQQKIKESEQKIYSLVDLYQIEAIAIGNGTASRETESFVKNITFGHPVQIFVVSENGASIYSASEIAREEFPNHDVTVRGAISIGRRLMDPLAELVKIDPKSIGVGQYQHDVNQKSLKESLEQEVEYCVNHVGVNVNTASAPLLSAVSGLGPKLAQTVVEYRASHGPYPSREALKSVPKLGPKAYEQSAGFLRIPQSKNPLDNTAVHPESYHIVEKMLETLQVSLSEFIADKSLRDSVDLNEFVTDQVGLPTLEDIMEELDKPGRDPRGQAEAFSFSDLVKKIEDVKKGMVLPGIVTNITNFGAFVDIGVKQDGLVHISEMADKYVSNPADVVSLHQPVKVKVMDVDVERKRIGLSMKEV